MKMWFVVAGLILADGLITLYAIIIRDYVECNPILAALSPWEILLVKGLSAIVALLIGFLPQKRGFTITAYALAGFYAAVVLLNIWQLLQGRG